MGDGDLRGLNGNGKKYNEKIKMKTLIHAEMFVYVKHLSIINVSIEIN